jgi:hypothetical protein
MELSLIVGGSPMECYIRKEDLDSMDAFVVVYNVAGKIKHSSVMSELDCFSFMGERNVIGIVSAVEYYTFYMNRPMAVGPVGGVATAMVSDPLARVASWFSSLKREQTAEAEAKPVVAASGGAASVASIRPASPLAIIAAPTSPSVPAAVGTMPVDTYDWLAPDLSLTQTTPVVNHAGTARLRALIKAKEEEGKW